MEWKIWLTLVLANFLGAMGNLSMKYATNQVDKLHPTSFLNLSFLTNFVLLPAVILAIVFAFIGRFLMFIPVSYSEVGLITGIGLILWVMFTILGGAILFKETYSLRVWVGFGLAFVSLYLLSEGL